MKNLHWIILALAVWILIVPFIGDDIIELLVGPGRTESLDLVSFMRWDDLFLGLAISILALFVVTIEQASHKTPGLIAMHWMQVILGLWVAVAPFALSLDYTAFTWSHAVSGGFITIFALLQLSLEYSKNTKK